jgi:hypothetical protein
MRGGCIGFLFVVQEWERAGGVDGKGGIIPEVSRNQLKWAY